MFFIVFNNNIVVFELVFDIIHPPWSDSINYVSLLYRASTDSASWVILLVFTMCIFSWKSRDLNHLYTLKESTEIHGNLIGHVKEV